MSDLNLKKICYDLVETFLIAGKRSLSIREQGLETKYKDDNTK